MPLTRRGGPPAFDLIWIDFPMSTASGDVIRCRLERSALDDLIHGSAAEKDFYNNRDKIEAVASAKYDSGQLSDGLVYISTRDLNPKQFAS